MLQTLSYLSLEVYPIEIKSNTPLLTKDDVPLSVGAVAHVKIQSDHASIAAAAENLLGKTDKEAKEIAKQSIYGHLRAVVGTLTKQELIRSLDSLTLKVKEASLPDLNKLGLTITSLTINELK